jgi:flagellar basal-body rod protein FlgC
MPSKIFTKYIKHNILQKEVKMNKVFIACFIGLLLISGCNTQERIAKNEPFELKIMFYANNQIEYIINYILYNNYNVEIIDEDYYIILKNINEETLMGIHKMVRLKMDIIADNIANVNTTRTIDGGPYIRKYLKITVENGIEIIEDTKSFFKYIYDPSHPDSIREGERKGYVKMPNVDLTSEMIDMIETSRIYNGILEYSKYYFKNIIW